MNAAPRRTLYQWQKAAAGIFFPQRLCVNCGAVSPDSPLCPDCRKIRQTLRPCPHCATFIAPRETADYCCGECRHQRPPFALARAALPYQALLRNRLLDFKYHGATGLRRVFAALLLETLVSRFSCLDFDAVTPVPLSARRLADRGYNQAELLSSLLSLELDIPHRPQYLRRVKDTQPLASLNRRQREQELTGAFQGLSQAEGQHILLIDDIYTSGATAVTATRALLKAGAAGVSVLTVAAGEDL